MSNIAQQEEQSVRPQATESVSASGSTAAPAPAPERPYVSPRVDIVESKDSYVLEAEMPGVAKDGLEISVEENTLTITGRRQPDPVGSLLYRESRVADYRRVFQLDPSIDSAKIGAQIEQGILTLTLPKAEKVKPRKITVN